MRMLESGRFESFITEIGDEVETSSLTEAEDVQLALVTVESICKTERTNELKNF